MSREANKALMRRFIDEVWNRGNLGVADELFAPSHTSPSAPSLPPGSAGTKILASMFRSAMPDYHIDIDLLVADDNQVAARLIQSGTHTGGALMGIPATGKKATWTEMGVLRVSDGKIVESWFEADMLGVMQQLGVATMPSAG